MTDPVQNLSDPVQNLSVKPCRNCHACAVQLRNHQYDQGTNEVGHFMMRPSTRSIQNMHCSSHLPHTARPYRHPHQGPKKLPRRRFRTQIAPGAMRRRPCVEHCLCLECVRIQLCLMPGRRKRMCVTGPGAGAGSSALSQLSKLRHVFALPERRYDML